ncbi:hypothetical protein D3C86_2239790 [compost metagenome]
MQDAFFRIGFIDKSGDTLVAALVGVNLAHDIERGRAFGFCRFGDGIVHFRLGAIKTLDGDSIIGL